MVKKKQVQKRLVLNTLNLELVVVREFKVLFDCARSELFLIYGPAIFFLLELLFQKGDFFI